MLSNSIAVQMLVTTYEGARAFLARRGVSAQLQSLLPAKHLHKYKPVGIVYIGFTKALRSVAHL
jgi:hypothetical protein